MKCKKIAFYWFLLKLRCGSGLQHNRLSASGWCNQIIGRGGATKLLGEHNPHFRLGSAPLVFIIIFYYEMTYTYTVL